MIPTDMKLNAQLEDAKRFTSKLAKQLEEKDSALEAARQTLQIAMEYELRQAEEIIRLRRELEQMTGDALEVPEMMCNHYKRENNQLRALVAELEATLSEQSGCGQ